MFCSLLFPSVLGVVRGINWFVVCGPWYVVLTGFQRRISSVVFQWFGLVYYFFWFHHGCCSCSSFTWCGFLSSAIWTSAWPRLLAPDSRYDHKPVAGLLSADRQFDGGRVVASCTDWDLVGESRGKLLMFSCVCSFVHRGFFRFRSICSLWGRRRIQSVVALRQKWKILGYLTIVSSFCMDSMWLIQSDYWSDLIEVGVLYFVSLFNFVNVYSLPLGFWNLPSFRIS